MSITYQMDLSSCSFVCSDNHGGGDCVLLNVQIVKDFLPVFLSKIAKSVS